MTQPSSPQTIARVALPVARDMCFDYRVPDSMALEPGSIVSVRLGRRRELGVVVALSDRSEVPLAKLQAIHHWFPELPAFPADVRHTIEFAARYYQQPLGLAYALAMPPLSTTEPTRAPLPAAYCVTPAGAAALPDLPARARAQTQLAQRLLAGEATRGELVALSSSAPRLLRDWLAAGWITAGEAVEPVGDTAGPMTLALNPGQQQAVAAITEALGSFAPILVHGITGSGKTEVYLGAAAAAIARGQQVLLLAPEINLTPKLVARVQRALPGAKLAVLHSNLADGERRAAWTRAAAGDADLIIGTRLAIFTPAPRLGLIVVDEEHDGSYKQDDGVRYSARDLALVRSQRLGCAIVLGSATPSLETYQHAQRGHYRRVQLAERAVASELPALQLVPPPAGMIEYDRVAGISSTLAVALEARLKRGEQSLVFVNRRGFSPSLFCRSCLWAAPCRRCSARLTLHLGDRLLRCHHCGDELPVPRACPSCGDQDLLPRGVGTERIAERLQTLFPHARIARVDRDTMQRKHAWSETLAAIERGDIDILVGTQMLAKGHDFPKLTLVGVVGADQALFSADFRATERLYALLLQVAGRAGRHDLPGEVLVQTEFPDHPLYQALRDSSLAGFERFAASLLAERESADLPPYRYLALMRLEARDAAHVMAFAAHAEALAAGLCGEDVVVYPPVAPGLERKAGLTRRQILVQANDRRRLQQFLHAWADALHESDERRVRWVVDVDPQDVN